MFPERTIPHCRCGRPIKFSNQTQCEDCWNEPPVISRRADGTPSVVGQPASSRSFVASVFPWADQTKHRPFGQLVKLGQMLSSDR
jgi:hypothetical protein